MALKLEYLNRWTLRLKECGGTLQRWLDILREGRVPAREEAEFLLSVSASLIAYLLQRNRETPEISSHAFRTAE